MSVGKHPVTLSNTVSPILQVELEHANLFHLYPREPHYRAVGLCYGKLHLRLMLLLLVFMVLEVREEHLS